MTPEEQLSAIYNQVHKLIPKHEKIFSDVEKLLRQHGIYCLRYAELESQEKIQLFLMMSIFITLIHLEKSFISSICILNFIRAVDGRTVRLKQLKQ